MAWGDPVTPDLVQATWLSGHRIRLEFEDGCAGVLDMGNRRWRGVFEPLQDISLFKQFRLERELNTIVWPTGADLAPEYLYEQASNNPVAGVEGQRRQASAEELPDRANDTSLAVAVGGSPAPSDAER